MICCCSFQVLASSAGRVCGLPWRDVADADLRNLQPRHAATRAQPQPIPQPLTSAMVELYLMSQERFTHDLQQHYIYSPLETLDAEGLVRIWAH